MKKLVSLFLAMMVLFSGLMIMNVHQTKDQERIESIEVTPDSFKVYVSNTIKTSEEMLQFFERLSSEYRITIFRSDFPEDSVIKSVVVNKKSFPFENFFQSNESFDLFEDTNQKYSSINKDDNELSIPTFRTNPTVTLQTMEYYYKNKDKSANGVYTIIPITSSDKDELLTNMADFFGTSIEDLETPKMQSRKEYINRDLMIYFILFFILALLTLLSILSIPMTQTKRIGVWKLCGYTIKDVFQKLFLVPFLTVISTSLFLNIAVNLLFSYLPQNFLFHLLLSQIFVLMILLISVLLSYSIIKSINVSYLIKNSLNFNIGIGLMIMLKTGTIILTTLVMIGSSTSIKEINKANDIYERASTEGKYLTVEKLGFTSDEAFKNFELSNGKNEDTVAKLFSDLENKIEAKFLYGSIVTPTRNFQSYDQSSIFNPEESYQVVRVNKNYLKEANISIENFELSNLFLVPKYLEKDKEKLEVLCRLLVQSRTVEETKQETLFEEIPINIEFYSDEKNKANIFLNNDLITFNTPIYELIDSQNLDHTSKIQLLTTGVTSPLRIDNTKSNRQYLDERTLPNKLGGINLHFTTISSILNTDADSSRLGLQIMITLLVVIFIVSLVVSGFVCVLYFNTYKRRISILRTLGIKLFDRYKEISLFLVAAYCIQIIVATIIGRSFIAIVIGFLLIFIDLIISFIILIYQENKNIVQVLKGE